MTLILLFTFAVGFFATSGAEDPYDVGYRLALGCLEFFLQLKNENVWYCYQENKYAYENSIKTFSKNYTEIKDIAYGYFFVPTKSRDFITWGLNEMNDIANSLNGFLVYLESNISNQKLVEGAEVIWRQRDELENRYGQYKKHGSDLKNLYENHYKLTFSLMDEAFKEILQKSDELTNEIIKCVTKKNLPF